MINLPFAFLTVARPVKAGTFVPRVVSLGERIGVVALIFNPGLPDFIPAKARARIDSLRSAMLAGSYTITVDTARAKP